MALRPTRAIRPCSLRLCSQPSCLRQVKQIPRPLSRLLTPRPLSRLLAQATLNTPFVSDTIPLAEGRLGTVEDLLVGIGDEVEINDVVAVVDTDKVALDVKAQQAGTVREILVAIGDEVNETQPLFTIDIKDASARPLGTL